MKRVWTRFRADQDGAVLVEFTLILIPFLLVSIGLVELGRFAWNRESLSDIALRAARCMAVELPACGGMGGFNASATEEMIRSEARQRWIDPAALSVSLDRDASCGGVAGFSRVEITYDYRAQFSLPEIVNALDRQIEVSSCFPNQD
jgi:hypothetical protein